MEYALGYREVIPDQTLPEKWKEVNLTIGTNQSTLQDIKVPERAGGYSYKDTTSYITRNRFIYWRISHDQLEMIEHSLDINLVNCCVRYKFTDTPLLDGISIHETNNFVVILVPTVSSVHKLSFTHPAKYGKKPEHFSEGHDNYMQSIFVEASSQSVTDTHTFHIIPNLGSTNTFIPYAATSWFIPSIPQAVFAFSYKTRVILVLKLDILNDHLEAVELKEESIVPRFLSGLATAFRGKSTESQTAMSLALHPAQNDTYLFALCREGDLKMWSCTKAQCLCMTDVVVNNKGTTTDAQHFMLRKVVNADSELLLGTYLKFETRSEFSIFRISKDSGTFKLERICSLFSSEQHLVDFSFTSTRLWAVWRTSDIDTISLKHAQLPTNNYALSCEWESVILEMPNDKDDIINDSKTDPRQIYINNIFKPGQFSLTDIVRALNIYRKTNVMTDMTLTPLEIKERVCIAVEAEIHNEVMDYELMDEDYLEIVNRCWSKFYSCIVQYHLNSSRPLGILLLPSVFGGVLIKKSIFSILRPMDAFENLMYCNEKSYATLYRKVSVLNQDDRTCQELIVLMSVIYLIEDNLSEELKIIIERELFHLKNPDMIVEDLIELIMEDIFGENNGNLQSRIYSKLESIKDISSAMAMLLEALTYSLYQYEKTKNDTIGLNYTKLQYSINSFFGSHLGISTLSESVSQIIKLRFGVCRNLLILQQIIALSPEFLDSQSLHVIKSCLGPRTVVLTQSYFVVKWICESNISIMPPEAILDINKHRLTSLKLSSCKPLVRLNNEQHLSSLLEMFIHSASDKFIVNLFNSLDFENENFTAWHYGMISAIGVISQFIWPISSEFIFPEWLLSNHQFIAIIEYVRLLSTWCEWNGASRKFILAIAYLEMGDSHKACDLFLKASNGVLNEKFLADAILESSVESESSALVQYYLKVIELFEHHSGFECIIELAETAMSISDSNDPNLPTLHSIIFTHHLNLEHYIEAYHYLNTNPEAARRIDCLRQLIVTLFNKKKLVELVSLPYVEMYEDLERIMENRARSVDLADNNYYNFMYSFHINKGNPRKAATIMYEQSMRLKHEQQTVSSILKQSQCLLACINALHLCNKDYKWIVRPIVDQSTEKRSEKKTLSRKDLLHYKVKKEIEVLDLNDIKNEHLLIQAKLKIMKLRPDIIVSPGTDALELIAILSNVHLYVTALDLCIALNSSKCLVFENLTTQCLRLTKSEDSSSWLWLYQNDLLDLSLATTTASDAAWRVLEYLTFQHEKKGESILHKCISSKLLFSGSFLPAWLYNSYKKRNPAQLLRLFLQYGRLTEAADLAVEYIQAVLGQGKENFGLQSELIAIAPAVYTPFNTFEILLAELEAAKNKDDDFSQFYRKLKKSLDNHINVATRVSDDMISMRRQCKSY